MTSAQRAASPRTSKVAIHGVCLGWMRAFCMNLIQGLAIATQIGADGRYSRWPEGGSGFKLDLVEGRQ